VSVECLKSGTLEHSVLRNGGPPVAPPPHSLNRVCNSVYREPHAGTPYSVFGSSNLKAIASNGIFLRLNSKVELEVYKQVLSVTGEEPVDGRDMSDVSFRSVPSRQGKISRLSLLDVVVSVKPCFQRPAIQLVGQLL